MPGPLPCRAAKALHWLPSCRQEAAALETILVDEEVTLRPFDVRDAAAFFELIDSNREHLAQWIPAFGFVQTLEDERVALRGMQTQLREGDIIGGAIEYLGHLVGAASISGLRSEGQPAALGYWIIEPVQGRGIATRVCRALIDEAFSERGAKQVEISAPTQNARSRAVADRLGFTLDGVRPQAFRCGGRMHDLAVYSLIAADWTSPAG